MRFIHDDMISKLVEKGKKKKPSSIQAHGNFIFDLQAHGNFHFLKVEI